MGTRTAGASASGLWLRALGCGPSARKNSSPARPYGTFSMRFPSAMPLRVIDDPSPFRDLLIIGMGEADASFSEEPFDQFASFRPPCAGDGTFAIRRRRLTTVGRVHVVRMAAMTEVEPSGLSDLRPGSTAAALVHRQEATVTQGVRRAPIPRRPSSGFLTGREPLKKRALPFIRSRPSFHGIQPTPRGHALYRPERAAPCRRSPPRTALGLPAASPRASPALNTPPAVATWLESDVPKSRLTLHQNERQMSVTSVISASRYHP